MTLAYRSPGLSRLGSPNPILTCIFVFQQVRLGKARSEGRILSEQNCRGNYRSPEAVLVAFRRLSHVSSLHNLSRDLPSLFLLIVTLVRVERYAQS